MPTAMVWGAAGGIGRALLSRLGAEGWQTVAITRHPERVRALAGATVELNDAANAADVDRAIYTAQFEVDHVDLWVYTVGDIVQSKVEDVDPAAVRRVLDANLTGAMLATRASLPLLAEQAHLFYLGAVSERLQLPGLAAYVAAKAGLEAFVATLAKEQRKRTVTIVRPGAVDTAFWDKVALRKPADAATPEQVAGRIWAAYAERQGGRLDITH